MAQGLFLLHSELVAASRDLLTLWQAADPIPGDVVTDHAAAVALMPQFSGYPAVVYEDATGERRCLFNPLTLEAVTAWREEIDNPSKPTVMSRDAFNRRFFQDEMLAIMAKQSTDVAIQVFLMLKAEAEEIDLADSRVTAALDHLVEVGLLTQDRATAILTP